MRINSNGIPGAAEPTPAAPVSTTTATHGSGRSGTDQIVVSRISGLLENASVERTERVRQFAASGAPEAAPIDVSRSMVRFYASGNPS